MSSINLKKVFFNKARSFRANSNLINIKQSTLILQTQEAGVLTKVQYEAFRKVVVRYRKGFIKIWFSSIQGTSITRKTSGHRMGKGVGSFSHIIFVVPKGFNLLEITDKQGWTPKLKRILGSAVKKLPIKVRFIRRGIKNLSLIKSL